MDKLDFQRHRRGVALLITLVTIAMMMVIIASLFKALDEAKKDSSDASALIQANLYYSDMVSLLNGLSADQKEGIFNILYEIPIPFSDENAGTVIVIDCKPLASGVNIHWLAPENVSKMSSNYAIVRQLFDAIAFQYGISDMALLEEMIMEQIAPENRYIPMHQSRLLQKNGIISFNQFEKIIERYRLEADDKAVEQVPWKKLFSFASDVKQIDANRMSPELAALLFDLDITLVKSEWGIEGYGFAQLVEDYSPDLYLTHKNVFAQTFIEYVRCNIGYQYREERYRFAFSDIEGRITHFEFYGRQ